MTLLEDGARGKGETFVAVLAEPYTSGADEPNLLALALRTRYISTGPAELFDGFEADFGVSVISRSL
jgi:hypothetical protein